MECSKKEGSYALASLPLLDDVNELIEKEKILLEFKVLEQQKEAHEWKLKYDNLLGKVSESALSSDSPDGYRLLEEVADNEVTAQNRIMMPDISDITDYIHKRGDHYILDMSGKTASFVLAQLTKGAHILKQYSSLLKSIHLRGCGLSDDHAEFLCSKLISNPVTTGIDLAFNDLGPAFLNLLFETLMKRKKTPEFLLLQGNMLLETSSSPSSFKNILGVLSDNTWGIGITLQDFRPLTYGGISDERIIKNLRKDQKVKKIAEDFTGSVNHPMHCLSFLKALKEHLDVEVEVEVDAQEIAKKSKTNKLFHNEKDKKNKMKVISSQTTHIGVVGKRTEGLHLMTTLALTYAHLSRNTVLTLEVLRNILRRKECQLIRINLAGNSLGDSGIEVLRSGLETSSTLTYLNVRSNNFTSVGLFALIEALKEGKGVLSAVDVTGNNDISDQEVMQAERELREKGVTCLLKYTSAGRHYNSSSFSSTFSSLSMTSLYVPGGISSLINQMKISQGTDIENRNRSLNPAMSSSNSLLGERVLYSEQLQIISMPESGDMEALLYSIDVKHLLHQYSNQKDQNLAFQWNMRSHCSSQFSISSSSSPSYKTRIFQDSRSSSSASSSLPYVSDYDMSSNPPSRVLNTSVSINNGNKKTLTESSKTANTINKYKTDSTLHWEIRIPTPQGGSVVSDGTIMLPPSPTCVERTEGGWVRCRGVILAEDIPLKGKIEIWVLNKSKNRRLNAIDVNHLEVSNISTTIKSTSLEWNNKESNEGINSNSRKIPFVSDVILQKGGDHEGWSHQYNQFCSLQCLFNNVNNHFDYPHIPEGFKMFRRILCLIDSSNNYNNNNNNNNNNDNNNKYKNIVNIDNDRKCKIIFQAKLKSDVNSNNKSNLANSKYIKDKENSLEKTIDGFGYKWCVIVKRFTAMVTSAGTGVQITGTRTGARTGAGAGRRMEIVARGECVHLNNMKEGPGTGADLSSKRCDTTDIADVTDSNIGSITGKNDENDNNYYNNNNNSSKSNNNKMNKNSQNDYNDISKDQPWIWLDISADLGPLHSGDEAFLCASPITMDGKTENINNFCSVEIRNFRYFYTISKTENRFRNENLKIAENVIRNGKTAMTDRQQSEYDENKVSQYSSKVIQIENRLHHSVHNDHSIVIPYF